MTVVNPSLKFAVLALLPLVVGLPLWVLLFTPEQFSPAMFVTPGFWIAVAAGLLSILFGFWVGTRSAYT